MLGRKGRNETLVRALSLLRLLENGARHRLPDIAARFAVTTRTVRRDLDALQRAGYAIGHDERGDGATTHDLRWWMEGR